MFLLESSQVLAGLIVLLLGGEVLVRGALAFTSTTRLSRLLIGLIVVSTATSTPELAVSFGALIRDEPSLAIGTAIGSNVANVLLVIGLSAAISPLVIKRHTARVDIPVMVGMVLLLLLFSLDGNVGWVDGIVLLLALVIHAALRLSKELRGVRQADRALQIPPASRPAHRIWRAALVMSAGVGLLSIGSQLIVSGAVAISTGLGVSNLVVGLTVVAIGTSFPELATSLSALRRGEGDIALGNIVGSNIFNIGLVLGLPAIIFPGGIRVPRDAITMDLPILLAAVVLLTAFAFTGLVIARWEGALFFVLYLVYVSYLVLDSIGSEAASIIGSIMVWFVLPALAAAVIAVFAHKVGVYRWVRSKFSRFVAKRPRKKPHRAE